MAAIPLALSTGSLYTYGIVRAFEYAAKAGFDAVEVLIDQRWDSRQPAYLQRLSQTSGLPVVAVHSPFAPHVPGWPYHELGRLRHSADVARQVGARIVVAHLPLRIRGAKVELYDFDAAPKLVPIFLPASDARYRRLLLDGLAEFEAAEGVWVAVENMPARRLLGFRLDIHSLNKLEVLATFPHLTLDTTHLASWGLDPLAVYERLRNRIAHVHLSDFDGRQHRLPGAGRLPLDRLLTQLAKDGYAGAVSLELSPEVLQAGDDARVLAHLQRAVRFCREHLSR